MNHDSLISMNIVYKNSILNGKYPILFYWNGVNDPVDDIVKDDKIANLLKAAIVIDDLYNNSTINYVTYKFDGEKDIYEEKEFYVKDYFSYEDIGLSVCQNIIISILKDAYYKVYGVNCDVTWLNSFDEQVKQIVDGIRNHYEKKISKETFVNYIRKSFKEQYTNGFNKEIQSKNEDILVSLAEASIQ